MREIDDIDADVIRDKAEIVRSFLFVCCILLGCVALAQCGCARLASAESPTRATARGAVLVIARAVREADVLCARYADDTGDVDTARACADAYDVARPALLAAEAGLDAWDSADSGRTACAVVDASRALRRLVEALDAVHVAIPPAARDAVELAAGLEGVCRAA